MSGQLRNVVPRRRLSPAHRGRGFLRRFGWVLVLAAACGVLFAASLSQSFAAPFNSDGAANVLQAYAMLHGNPLLHGWWTSDVSFYTTELPEYALVTAVRGLTPDVVHICGALSYTLTVLLAGVLAYGSPDRDGQGGVSRAGLARAGTTVAILLAPSVFGGTEVFLQNPDHAGTAVPVLAVLLVVDRMDGRRGSRWYLAAAVCALLALAQVGDELTVAAATVPIAVVSVFRLLIRAGAGSAGGSGPRSDWLLLGAAVASAGIAKATELALVSLGGFTLKSYPHKLLAPLDQLPGHARALWSVLLLIFGVRWPAPHNPPTRTWHTELVAMADLHFIGLVLAAVGLVVGLATFASRRADRVTQVLVVAVLAMLSAGLFGTLLHSLSTAHEVAILLPLGAVLAGRTLPRLLRNLSRSARRGAPAPASGTWLARGAWLLLGAWLVVGAAELGFGAAWPPASPAEQTLATWLVAHHEREGLAGYWQADVTTVVTGGRVLVAPVRTKPAGNGSRRWQPGEWESSASWYQPSQHRATFVIATANPAGGRGALTVATTRATFGPPAASYRVGGYIIMTYHYNLLTRHRSRLAGNGPEKSAFHPG